MNREIKFRYVYKNITTNEILILFYSLEDVEDSTASLDRDRLWNEGYSLISRDLYTGLKDKNNKEIYDRDIVKCLEVTNTDISEYVSDVYWDNCYYGVHQSNTCDVDLGLFDSTELLYQCPLTEIEIIGNIYENPELLEAANE